MPDENGLGTDCPERPGGIVVVVRPGKDDDRD
jgi:hypothetical protein